MSIIILMSVYPQLLIYLFWCSCLSKACQVYISKLLKCNSYLPWSPLIYVSFYNMPLIKIVWETNKMNASSVYFTSLIFIFIHFITFSMKILKIYDDSGELYLTSLIIFYHFVHINLYLSMCIGAYKFFELNFNLLNWMPSLSQQSLHNLFYLC